MGEWRHNSVILVLGATWKRVKSFTPLPLDSRRNLPQSAFHRKLGGPHSRSGSCRIEPARSLRYAGSYLKQKENKLRGHSLRENYTDRATIACRQS
jgi:hypothetical protein